MLRRRQANQRQIDRGEQKGPAARREPQQDEKPSPFDLDEIVTAWNAA